MAVSVIRSLVLCCGATRTPRVALGVASHSVRRSPDLLASSTGLPEKRVRPFELAGELEGLGEPQGQRRARWVVGQEGEGAAEEVHRSRSVLAIQGAPACRLEPIPGTLAERTQLVDRAELRPVVVGLFEVISDDLVLVAAQAVQTRSIQPATPSWSSARRDLGSER